MAMCVLSAVGIWRQFWDGNTGVISSLEWRPSVFSSLGAYWWPMTCYRGEGRMHFSFKYKTDKTWVITDVVKCVISSKFLSTQAITPSKPLTQDHTKDFEWVQTWLHESLHQIFWITSTVGPFYDIRWDKFFYHHLKKMWVKPYLWQNIWHNAVL